jgi:hypothetical protein
MVEPEEEGVLVYGSTPSASSGSRPRDAQLKARIRSSLIKAGPGHVSGRSLHDGLPSIEDRALGQCGVALVESCLRRNIRAVGGYG